jgi:C-terminal processing protease CtpA/Prc
VTPNFSLPSLQKAVPGWARKSPTVFAGQFGDGIGYVMITTWAKDRAKELQAAFDVLEDPQCSKGLIIDVRPNSGGDELLARAFAGCFVAEPRVYAKHTVRDGGKFSSIGARTVWPNPDHPRYQGKVAVLMGRANMSSCESFLLMMKQAENCTLVGERSYGSSGNPQPVTLGNGITLYVPSWKDLRPDGTCFEGEGLAPDLEVKAEAREFESGDPVLEAALVLRRRP